MNKEESPLVKTFSASITNKKNTSEPPPNLNEIPVKFCKDCAEFNKERVPQCFSPFNTYRDIVEGEIRYKADLCGDLRNSELFCGQIAKWFIPKMP